MREGYSSCGSKTQLVVCERVVGLVMNETAAAKARSRRARVQREMVCRVSTLKRSSSGQNRKFSAQGQPTNTAVSMHKHSDHYEHLVNRDGLEQRARLR